MADIDKWAGDTFPLADWVADIDPGVDNAKIVSDKTVSITVIRLGTPQSAQSVRIEELRARERDVVSTSGVQAKVDALIIGYKGHPTITDTDIQRGDRFEYEDEGYEVVALMPGLTDTFQAYAKIRS